MPTTPANTLNRTAPARRLGRTAAGCVPWILVAVTLLAALGHFNSVHAEEASSSEGPFGTLPLPAGYDQEDATLALDEIPGAPEPPETNEDYAPPELPRQALRRMEEARRLFSEHRFSETILKLNQALRYNAENLEAHRMMAVASLMSGDRRGAKQSAGRGVDLVNHDLVCQYVLGRVAEQEHKSDLALKQYRLSLLCPAGDTDDTYRTLTHYYLGSLLYEKGYYAAAARQLEAFEQGVRVLDKTAGGNAELETLMNTQRGNAAMRQGRAYGILGEYAKAAEALVLAAESTPRDLELRSEAIRMLVRADRMDEAERHAAELVADSAGNADALQLFMAVHERSGQTEQGLDAIRDMLDEHPERTELWLVYADGLIAQERYDEAITAMSDLLERESDLTVVRWKLIALQRQREHWSAWLNALAEEIALHPPSYEKAVLEITQAPTEARSRIVREAVKAGPDADWFTPIKQPARDRAAQLCLLGDLAESLDQAKQAKDFYLASIDADAGFYPPAVGATKMHLRRTLWKEGIAMAEKVTLEAPSAHLERVLGQCYDGLDQRDDATLHYAKAIDIDPKDVMARILLAEMHARYNDMTNSNRVYEEALEVDRHNLRIMEGLIRNHFRTFAIQFAKTEKERARIAELAHRMRSVAPEAPETLRTWALIELVGKPEQYVDTLKELIKRWPDDLRTLQDLAMAQYTLEQWDEAFTTLQSMIERDPYHAAAHEMLSEVLRRRLAYAEALVQYERMMEMHPNREAWLMDYAELLMLTLKEGEAARQYEHLLTLDASQRRHLHYKTELMKAYRRSGQADKGAERAKAWIAEAEVGHLPLYRWFLLTIDLEKKDLDGYLARCEEWLEENPNDEQLRGWYLGVDRRAVINRTFFDTFSQACGLIAAERDEEAIALALQWYAESGKDEPYARWITEVFAETGRHDDSIAWARSQEASAEHPLGRVWAMQTLRTLHNRAGLFAESISILEDMIKVSSQIDEENLNIDEVIFIWRRELGMLLSQAGKREEAVTLLERLLYDASRRKDDNRDRRVVDALQALALVLQEQGRAAEAIEHMRKAQALMPDDIGLYNDLGYTMADHGMHLDEAEAMIRKAVSARPQLPAYMDSLGWVLYKKEDFTGAKLWLERAAAMPDGLDPVIFDHLGDVYWRLNDPEQAVKYWKRAQALHDRRVAEGLQVRDEELMELLDDKQDAAAAGGAPEIAPVGEHGMKEVSAAPEESAP